MRKRKKILSVTKEDLKWDFFSAGGPGGQNQNRRSTGVRVTHPPSGAVGEARDTRHQRQNRILALHRLANSQKFKSWVAAVRSGIEEQVDEWMRPENLHVETGGNF